jgi:hypothetical protein
VRAEAPRGLEDRAIDGVVVAHRGPREREAQLAGGAAEREGLGAGERVAELGGGPVGQQQGEAVFMEARLVGLLLRGNEHEGAAGAGALAAGGRDGCGVALACLPDEAAVGVGIDAREQREARLGRELPEGLGEPGRLALEEAEGEGVVLRAGDARPPIRACRGAWGSACAAGSPCTRARTRCDRSAPAQRRAADRRRCSRPSRSSVAPCPWPPGPRP